jgi:uncharacterized protein (DUF58 family)
MRALPASPLLDAEALAGVRDLQLVARTMVEGFLAGLHLGRRLAVGVEFSQYRPYAQGDDPRGIDWRLHARTDRYFMREAHGERDVVVRLILDATASMGAPRSEDPSKFDIARRIAAALAYLADRQGDTVRLEIVGGTEEGADLGRGGGLGALLHRLERVKPAGAWTSAAGALLRHRSRSGRELVILISDCWESEREIQQSLGSLASLRHEVLVARVLTPSEIDLPSASEALFEDAETGERVAVRGSSARNAYAAQFAAHRAQLERSLLELGIGFVDLRTDQPFDSGLRSFLLRRQNLP